MNITSTKEQSTDQPVAYIKAVELVKGSIGEIPSSSLITLERLEYTSGLVRFKARYMASADSKNLSVPGELSITEEDYDEYTAWWTALLERSSIKLDEKATDALRVSGFYTKDTVGLKSALKIWNILNHSFEALSATEILEEESKVVSMESNSFAARLIGQSIILSEPSGKMKITARRALAALSEAGLIEKAGATSSMKYSVA